MICATYWKRFVALFCAKRGTCQIPSPDVTPHKILLRIVSTIFGKEWFTRPRWGCWLLTCMDPIKEPPCWFADPSHKLGLKLFGLVETPRWLRETCSIKTLQWQLGGIRGCKRNWEALINFHAVGGEEGCGRIAGPSVIHSGHDLRKCHNPTLSHSSVRISKTPLSYFSWLSFHIHHQSDCSWRVHFGKKFISKLQISAFFLDFCRLPYIYPVGRSVGWLTSPLIFSIYRGIKALY